MDPSALQEIMGRKHIVVTGIPHDKNVKFDETAMRTLIGSLSSQVSINGAPRFCFFVFFFLYSNLFLIFS